jgi:hypothetical protein
MIRNLHIYPSSFKFETRIMKETNSLIKLNLVNKIIIVSFWEDGLKEYEDIDENRKVIRFKLCSRYLGIFSKFFNYVEFTIRLFFKYQSISLDYVNCHSLLVLPIGVLLKKYGRTKILIYDPHELETERVGLGGKAKKLIKWLERKLIVFCDKTIVICDPIADWYKNHYKLKHVHVIRNVPNRYNLPEIKSTRLKEKFNIPYNHIVYIYQGILKKERGIDTLLHVFSAVPEDKHIVFMGYGDSEYLIKEYEKRTVNVHFHEAVGLSEIMEYTSSADIGIFFISGEVCLSYEYCLPNKFGEYLFAGLPVLVSSSLAYLSNIVLSEKCGWSLDANSTNELIEFVIKTDMKQVSEKIKYVKKYSETLAWDFEEVNYTQIYK